MYKIIFTIFLLFSVLQAEGIGLDLPKKFDVKLSKKLTDKDLYCVACCYLPFKTTPLIFNFDNGIVNATINTKVDGYYHYINISGNFSSGKFEGKYIRKQGNYYKKRSLHSLMTEQAKLKGEYDKATGILDIYIIGVKTVLSKIKKKKNGKISAYGTWRIDYSSSVDFGTGGGWNFYLQLPINQSQSSQTFIPDTPAESESTQEQPQPITIPKTDLSANVGISDEAIEPEPKIIEAYDQCKDPNRDEAVEEYCKNKAYNAKLDQEEAALDKAQEKSWEEKEKKEKAQQKMLDEWYEEDRQANIKHIEGLSEQKKRSQEAEQKENQAFHNKLAKDMQERKAIQAKKKLAHFMVDRYGEGDPESRKLTHKKIEELSKNADIEKMGKITNAVRKQYYDSSQARHEAKTVYQLEKDKELAISVKRAEVIRDTAVTINKALAKLDPTGTGDKIVSWQENSYDAIDSYAKGGVDTVIDKFVEKKASELSGSWSDTVKEEIETYKKYQKGGNIILKKSEYYYDIKGNRFTKVKKGQKLYDKDHNEITFSFKKRIFSNTIKKLNDDYNSINTASTKVEEIKEGVVTGDLNKAVNAGLDAMDAKESIDGSTTDGVVKKLEGL